MKYTNISTDGVCPTIDKLHLTYGDAAKSMQLGENQKEDEDKRREEGKRDQEGGSKPISAT